MSSSNVTIRDVAHLANTSVATVSRVLSGKPGVGVGKREQIKALAEQLGYRPNRVAQNLAMNRSRVIGIIASDLRMSDVKGSSCRDPSKGLLHTFAILRLKPGSMGTT